jgi:positive regulator of sigma E activity
VALRRATVVAVEPGAVEVRLAPGCGSCSGCAGACGVVRSNWHLPTGDATFTPGRVIDVQIREHALRRIALRAYGAWLLGLVGGALAGMTFGALVLGAGHPHDNGVSDLSVLLFAAAGTCAGIAWSHRSLRAMARRGEYLTYEVVNPILEEEST